MSNEESSQELVVPGIGTLVNLASPSECSFALDDIRDLERQFRYVKQELTEAIVRACEIEGTKTLHFEGGTAVLKSGQEWEYDPEEIEVGLRAAGMPEHRIREIVKETVSYKVDANKAKQASSANPSYGEVIEAHKKPVEKAPYVTVKRGGTA
jgi:hypothetical protein